MTNRVQRLLDFFERHPEEIPWGGIFDCPNTVADPTEVIYAEGNVRVWACHYYDYIEILGLTDEEFKDACQGIGKLSFDFAHPDFDIYDDNLI